MDKNAIDIKILSITKKKRRMYNRQKFTFQHEAQFKRGKKRLRLQMHVQRVEIRLMMYIQNNKDTVLNVSE